MTGPSAHLSWDELRCKDGTVYPLLWRSTRAVELARAFERVRLVVGAPLRVTSGYRTEAHNRRRGGARFSQHVQGRALDLLPPPGMIPLTLFNLIRGVVKEAGIRGLGLYPTFVHIDVRPSAKLIVWTGTRAWAEMP
jgi:uncharacterized protein YcbK (DUF882 family)